MSIPPPLQGFPAFYSENYVRVVRCVRPLVDSVEDAEDIAQDAFAQAYARWTDVVSVHPEPEAWVKLVAINLGRSRLRRARVAARKIVLRCHDLAIGSGHDDRIIERTDLTRALDQLPPRQREVLKMHYLEDTSIRDVALALGASETSVKTNLHRGRARLSQIMERTQP